MSPKEIVALKNGMRNATPSAWLYGSLSSTEAHCLSFLSLQIFRALRRTVAARKLALLRWLHDADRS